MSGSSSTTRMRGRTIVDVMISSPAIGDVSILLLEWLEGRVACIVGALTAVVMRLMLLGFEDHANNVQRHRKVVLG